MTIKNIEKQTEEIQNIVKQKILELNKTKETNAADKKEMLKAQQAMNEHKGADSDVQLNYMNNFHIAQQKYQQTETE